MSKSGIALIGCGAIAETFHLPALVRHDELKRSLILVDPSAERARKLADRFAIARTALRLEEVLPELQAAIIATPHHLHAPLARQCLEAGVHVLSEKPIAESAADAQLIARLADERKLIAAVNNTRRIFPAFQSVAQLIATGEIGTLTRMELILGEQFDWPAASGSYFGKAAGGKGVLLDTGAHIVDLACWWAGKKPRLIDYQDDAMGGTEAVAHVTLSSDDCVISIRLSWLSKLANTYRIDGSLGVIQGQMYDEKTTTIVRGSRSQVVKAGTAAGSLASVMIDNFLASITGRARPMVTVHDVLPSIEIIEECYTRRRSFDMPWFDAWNRVVTHA